MPTYTISTDFPVAVDSLDHNEPWGTVNDNSRNEAFNRRLYELTGGASLRVLDIGCAGGGMVKSFIEDGHEAVGIEGSDYSKARRRAEWATIPGNLFTADATKEFQIFRDDLPATFNVITSWEFLEHIAEHDLPAVIQNMKRHATPDSLFIHSISPVAEKYHQTVKNAEWWEGLLASHGLANDPSLVSYFGNDAWVRGHNQGAPHSFHVVGKMAGSSTS